MLVLGERLGHVPELGALDLETIGRRRLGKVRHGEHAHRYLVVGKAAAAVRDHFLLVERGGRLENHEGDGAHALGPRHGNGLALRDARQLLDVGLDLQRIDQEARQSLWRPIRRTIWSIS